MVELLKIVVVIVMLGGVNLVLKGFERFHDPESDFSRDRKSLSVDSDSADDRFV